MDNIILAFLITGLCYAGYKAYKYYTTPQQYYIDKESKDIIDKLYDLKAQHSKILQFIFEYDTSRDNHDKEFKISWFNEMGDFMETPIWQGNGKHNTDKKYKANLRKSAEAYEQHLAERIDALIKELYNHNSQLQQQGIPQFPLWNYTRSAEEKTTEKTTEKTKKED